MFHRLVPVVFPILVLSVAAAVAASPAKHPNLLLNRDEIAQVKAKIAKYPWATVALEKTKQHALNGPVHENAGVNQALYYVLTGDKSFADRARAELLSSAKSELPEFRKFDVAKTPEFGSWSNWGARAWTYDLIYDTCSDAERAQIEEWLRVSCRVLIDTCKRWSTTPNLMFGKHVNIGLVGYCLGDKEIIDWVLNDPGTFGPHCGGFYAVMDTMIKDGRFWGEAPIYALVYDVPNMLALAEAARHYDGTDLCHWTSKKSGASIKSVIDGYLLMGYPLERTGIGQGRVRLATFGDGGTSFNPSGTMGKDPEDLTDPSYLTCLELAYARYKDSGYAWMLSLPPDRNTLGWIGRSPFGYLALSHGEPLPEKPTPPPAPSGVYASQGFALIRSDESPSYWTSGALAALVTLGKTVGHGHNDHYELVLHGKGRLLYPDLNVIQYEPTYLGWTHEGIGHSTLLVDHQSPASNEFTTSHDFTPEVKFFAISGGAFKNIRQTRRLLMTKEYLADVFHAADQQGQSRTFDWALHGLGRLYPTNPAAYRPTNALVPYYWWVVNERGRTVDSTFQMDWIQRTGGFIEGRQFGPEWFKHEVGSRTTVMGVPGTQVYYGDGPVTSGEPYCFFDGSPEPASPVAVVRREATAATFAAVHEPYEGAPTISRVRWLAEDDGAVALVVKTPGYTDYLCVGFDDREHTLAAGGEAFAFTEYGYLRVQGGSVTGRGKLRTFKVPANQAGRAVMLNGKPASVRREGESLVYGAPPAPSTAPAPKPEDDPRERGAALHYWWLPQEVHLSALTEGDTREVAVHLRTVGAGQAAGRLQIAAPQGLAVDPPAIDVPPLAAGQEQIVKLTIRKTDKLPRDLYPLRFVPAEGTPAAPQILTASVGVVITVDRRVPLSMQYVVRAPGYTINVDGYSGVSFYILDADGHRRHGRLYGLNFQYGIPSVEGASRWRTPAGFIWQGEDNLTIGADPARLHYKFYEDRMVFAVTQPIDPTKTWTMWIGTFEGLGAPIHTGKQEQPWLPITADWLFFPHPTYRQGILLTPPRQAPVKYCLGGPDCDAVNFPIKAGQAVSLQFATKAEVDALKQSGKLPPRRQ